MFLGRVDENGSNSARTQVLADDTIPVSVLALDLGEPAEGWDAFLAAHNVTVAEDDLGRPAVARSAARMLLAERRAAEARAREVMARQEAEAVAADQERRARIWKGLSADQIPVGMTLGELFAATDREGRPRRKNPVEAALDGDGAVYYPIEQEAS